MKKLLTILIVILIIPLAMADFEQVTHQPCSVGNIIAKYPKAGEYCWADDHRLYYVDGNELWGAQWKNAKYINNKPVPFGPKFDNTHDPSDDGEAGKGIHRSEYALLLKTYQEKQKLAAQKSKGIIGGSSGQDFADSCTTGKYVVAVDIYGMNAVQGFCSDIANSAPTPLKKLGSPDPPISGKRFECPTGSYIYKVRVGIDSDTKDKVTALQFSCRNLDGVHTKESSTVIALKTKYDSVACPAGKLVSGFKGGGAISRFGITCSSHLKPPAKPKGVCPNQMAITGASNLVSPVFLKNMKTHCPDTNYNNQAKNGKSLKDQLNQQLNSALNPLPDVLLFSPSGNTCSKSGNSDEKTGRNTVATLRKMLEKAKAIPKIGVLLISPRENKDQSCVKAVNEALVNVIPELQSDGFNVIAINTNSELDPNNDGRCDLCKSGQQHHWNPEGQKLVAAKIVSDLFGQPGPVRPGIPQPAPPGIPDPLPPTPPPAAPTTPSTSPAGAINQQCNSQDQCKKIDDVWLRFRPFLKVRQEVYVPSQGWTSYGTLYAPAPQAPSAPQPGPSSPDGPLSIKIHNLQPWFDDWTNFIKQGIDNLAPELLENANMPADALTLCPNYKSGSLEQKKNFWVVVMSSIARYESGFNPNKRFFESFNIWSEGLLQLSYGDETRHSGCPISPSSKNILDPKINLECGVVIMKNQLIRDKTLFTPNSPYWSVLDQGNLNQPKVVQSIKDHLPQLPFCTGTVAPQPAPPVSPQPVPPVGSFKEPVYPAAPQPLKAGHKGIETLAMTGGDPYLRAFMRMITWKEATSKTCDGVSPYNTVVGGQIREDPLNRYVAKKKNCAGHYFKGYDGHPQILTSLSTAAGRYQYLSRTWFNSNKNRGWAKKSPGGPTDFGPVNQDITAYNYLKRRGVHKVLQNAGTNPSMTNAAFVAYWRQVMAPAQLPSHTKCKKTQCTKGKGSNKRTFTNGQIITGKDGLDRRGRMAKLDGGFTGIPGGKGMGATWSSLPYGCYGSQGCHGLNSKRFKDTLNIYAALLKEELAASSQQLTVPVTAAPPSHTSTGPTSASQSSTDSIVPDLFAKLKTAQTTHQFLQQINSAYPGKTQLSSIGLSSTGKNIYGLKLSKGSGYKPSVFVNCAHHSVERKTPEICFRFINDLLSPGGDQYLNKFNFWVVPYVNVDRIHRKNSNGVDLNRNYPYKWNITKGRTSKNPSSIYYHGPSPASESEVQGIMSLSKKENFAITVSVHCCTKGRIYHGYTTGNTKNPQPHINKHFAKIMSKKSKKPDGNLYKSARWVYPVYGADQDWFHHEIGSIALLIETPKTTSVAQRRSLSKGLMPGFWALLDEYNSKPKVRVQVQFNGKPVKAKIMANDIKYFENEAFHSDTTHGIREIVYLTPGAKTITIEYKGKTKEINVNAQPGESTIKVDMNSVT
tara:strand:- start:72251 stop:76519 length:4269 start_codon:yes stop_codon:yes gene_type:complete